MFRRRKDPPSPEPPDVILRCSFCNKSQRHVRKLIAGPRVQICDECVDICLDVLNEEKESVPSRAVDGRAERSLVLLCALCRIPTAFDESLAVPNRGVLCAGCAAAFETALAEQRSGPS